MRRDEWKVIEGDNRPAGPPDRCFYCNQPHGGQHAQGCVIRSRTVVVSTTIEWVIDVPEDWDAEMIEFSRNDGSRCSDNDVSDLREMIDRMKAEGKCSCALIRTKFLREATAEDEQDCAWPQDDPHHPK